MTQSLENIWDHILTAGLSLGVPAETIAVWKTRGYVPPSYHYEMAVRSLELGVALSHKEMHEMWKRHRYPDAN
jgi:hypothetical protein